jgi:fructokinase
VTQSFKVVGIGELLWDVLPEGQKLGGAPANFAYITQMLGGHGEVASRLGNDPLGDEALAQLAAKGLDTQYVQRDSEHPTSTVDVHLEGGQPSYQIHEAVAWDFMEWTPQWRELAWSADAVCFGSLAQRSATSRATIREFLAGTREEAVRIFDVNLRQHYFSAEVLAESIRLADLVKLNHEELPRIISLLGLHSGSEVENAQRLRAAMGLKLVCVTRGGSGSLIVTAHEVAEHPGCPVTVADTVGAGDAFTAGLVHQYLRGASLAQMSETANRVGAWVASQAGAMPAPASGEIEAILRAKA